MFDSLLPELRGPETVGGCWWGGKFFLSLAQLGLSIRQLLLAKKPPTVTGFKGQQSYMISTLLQCNFHFSRSTGT